MKINEVLVEQQLDELSWQDVKQGASNLVKGAKLGYNDPRAAANLSKNPNTGTMTKVGRLAGRGAKALGKGVAAIPGAIQQGAAAVEKGANAYTQGVKAAGDAVAGAANAVGRAGAETFKQAVARPVAGTWNAGKTVAQGATGAVKAGYGDTKNAVKTVGQGIDTVANDAGDLGTWAGDKVKQAGRGAANVVGGTAQAVGAVAATPQGVGRAAKRGYNAGVQNIGGPDEVTPGAEAGATADTTTQTAQDTSTTTANGTPATGNKFAQGLAKGLGADRLAQDIKDYDSAQTGTAGEKQPAQAATPAAPAAKTPGKSKEYTQGYQDGEVEASPDYQQGYSDGKAAGAVKTPQAKPANFAQRPASYGTTNVKMAPMPSNMIGSKAPAKAAAPAVAEDVKQLHSSMKHRFAIMTMESLESWVKSKSAEVTDQRLVEATLLEISYRKAKLKKRYK